MKTIRHCAVLVFVAAVCAAQTFADEPGRHPAYLHALSDLRRARAHLNRVTPSGRIDNEEQHAIAEIDKAIWEIKQASIDDGKDLNDHPPVDAHLGSRARLHRALELLDQAHNDIAHEEDDSFARGLRNRGSSTLTKPTASWIASSFRPPETKLPGRCRTLLPRDSLAVIFLLT